MDYESKFDIWVVLWTFLPYESTVPQQKSLADLQGKLSLNVGQLCDVMMSIAASIIYLDFLSLAPLPPSFSKLVFAWKNAHADFHAYFPTELLPWQNTLM